MGFKRGKLERRLFVHESHEASVLDGERRGFRVKPTAKYVVECVHIVQLQHAMAVMTPLTEQKSLNLRDETTVCAIKFNILCSELLLENCSTLPERDRI